MEFIQNLFSNFWFESFFKLALGFALAGIIGLERSSWNKPAGFRTHSLVGISSVLIMICGEYLSTKYNADPTRIPAQLLSGIGFIGAGTILRDGFNVKGLTTASSLLAVTCIGLSIGAGFYLGGIVATAIVYFILSYSYVFSAKLDHFDVLMLKVDVNLSPKDMINKIQFFLEANDLAIQEISQLEDTNSEYNSIKLVCKFNNKFYNKNKIITSLLSLDNVVSVIDI